MPSGGTYLPLTLGVRGVERESRDCKSVVNDTVWSSYGSIIVQVCASDVSFCDIIPFWRWLLKSGKCEVFVAYM